VKGGYLKGQQYIPPLLWCICMHGRRKERVFPPSVRLFRLFIYYSSPCDSSPVCLSNPNPARW
jgi:hypothetical protein